MKVVSQGCGGSRRISGYSGFTILTKAGKKNEEEEFRMSGKKLKLKPE